MTKKILSNGILTIAVSDWNGELTSIQKDGTEYLWQGDKQYWSGQAPILFPICGALRDGKYELDGTFYSMPKHGIARRTAYEFAGETADSVTCVLHSSEKTLEQFPFEFSLYVTYRLDGNQIRNEFRIENHSSRPMPFALGGHPGFRCPLLPGEAFEDYQIVFPAAEQAHVLPLEPETLLPDVSRPILFLDGSSSFDVRHTPLLHDALIFSDLKSRQVSLKHPRTGLGAAVEFPDMPYLLIWSAKDGAPFLALEPWSGLPTCTDEGYDFANKKGMRTVPAGGSDTLSFTISIF